MYTFESSRWAAHWPFIPSHVSVDAVPSSSPAARAMASASKSRLSACV